MFIILQLASVRNASTSLPAVLNNNRRRFPFISLFVDFELDKAEKAIAKLEESWINLPDVLSADDVHALRTQARRVEAVAQTFRLDHKRPGRMLLKILKPIRRAAGEARDLDISIELASSLEAEDDDACSTQFLEYILNKRFNSARKLRKKVVAKHKGLTRSLKRCRVLVEDRFVLSNGSSSPSRRFQANAHAAALKLVSELSGQMLLSASNLHRYRIKVKKLRYILELAAAGHSTFFHDLGEVKDAIGKWHDWAELEKVAAKVLDRKHASNLMQQIRSNTSEALSHALELAAALRQSSATVELL